MQNTYQRIVQDRKKVRLPVKTLPAASEALRKVTSPQKVADNSKKGQENRKRWRPLLP